MQNMREKLRRKLSMKDEQGKLEPSKEWVMQSSDMSFSQH